MTVKIIAVYSQKFDRMLNHYTKAISTNYANFQGRARRSEYWSFYLINIIVSLAVSMIDGVFDTAFISPLYSLAMLVPGIAITARRLHDVGRSGWWMLIAFTWAWDAAEMLHRSRTAVDAVTSAKRMSAAVPATFADGMTTRGPRTRAVSLADLARSDVAAASLRAWEAAATACCDTAASASWKKATMPLTHSRTRRTSRASRVGGEAT